LLPKDNKKRGKIKTKYLILYKVIHNLRKVAVIIQDGKIIKQD